MGDLHKYKEACEAILVATEMLIDSIGNAWEMLKYTKVLAEATSKLVKAIKEECDGQKDLDTKTRHLSTIKNLTDATSHMATAAKVTTDTIVKL